MLKNNNKQSMKKNLKIMVLIPLIQNMCNKNKKNINNKMILQNSIQETIKI